MHLTRIAALLEPFLGPPDEGQRKEDEGRLTGSDLDKISTYIDLLLHWNARINLTAIRDPEQIVTRHFGESFFLARHLFPLSEIQRSHPERSENFTKSEVLAESRDPYFTQPTRGQSARKGSQLEARSSKLAIDIGSGAGFPALPLKIWAPGIHLTLIESNHKKAAFLREVARELTLTNINVIAERAETIAARPASEFPRADVVTFRAVEKFDRTLPLAIALLASKGRLAILIGSSQLPRLQPSSLNTSHTLSWQTFPVPDSRTRLLAILEH